MALRLTPLFRSRFVLPPVQPSERSKLLKVARDFFKNRDPFDDLPPLKWDAKEYAGWAAFIAVLGAEGWLMIHDFGPPQNMTK